MRRLFDEAVDEAGYPSSGPMTATGWSAMAKTITDADEGRIKDCKEDIDTLLVFAGLFSAVMTAFLLESCKTLQVDPSNTMIGLLQQIACQDNFSSTNAVCLHAAAFTNDAFEPPPAAVRINVLWFISLVLSLVTASYGMLVKQWLREYLATNYTSPQARLRVRHFRFPGLLAWKIFEIAAFLPLLLQLALGLFLVGLCIFTMTIHETIGKTTIPLVCGWAFFFLFATFAPVLSPRCPYKTTLLKGFLDSTRRRLISLSSNRAIAALRTRLHTLQHSIQFATSPIARRGPLRRNDHDVETCDESSSFSESVVSSFSTDIDTIHHFGSSSHITREDDVARIDTYDLDILLAVDALQVDDDLLGTVMRESLRQASSPGPVVVSFVLRILSHRIERKDQSQEAWPQAQNLPLQFGSVSRRAWLAVLGIVTDALARELDHQLRSEDQELTWSGWMSHALLILVSPSGSYVPRRTISVIVRCMVHGRAPACSTLGLPARTDSGDIDIFDGILHIVRDALRSLDGETSLAILEEIMAVRLNVGTPESFSLGDVKNHPWQRLISPRGLRPLVDLLVDILNMELDKFADLTNAVSWPSWLTCALSGFLALYTEMPRWTADAEALFIRLFTTPSFLPHFLLCMARSPVDRVISAMHVKTFTQHIAQIAKALTSFELDVLKQGDIVPIFDLLQMCHVILAVIPFDRSGEEAYSPDLKVFFSRLAALLCHADVVGVSEECETKAAKRLDFICYLDTHSYLYQRGRDYIEALAYEDWLNTFDPEKSLFGDELIDILSKIASRDMSGFRVRRIQELKAGKLLSLCH